MNTWYERVRTLTLRLVSWPSITNTAGETQFGQRLFDLLATQPYFQAHPENLRLERTAHDLHERYNVFALVRGTGPRTVALASHYDVVGIANYGSLAEWAYAPEELLPRLIDELERAPTGAGDQLALTDLRSGAYLPGRGALDMKSGLAAGIALLERFAQEPSAQGNLLLIATPDEEEASHGMRTAASLLPKLAGEWGLELQAAINLDASGERDDDGAGRAVYLGTVGKLLPSVLLIGRESHAGSPFDGVNPNLLAAELTRRVECNVALADNAAGAVAPPPVSLKQADLKAHYDVTMPHAAWCYFNLLTHRRTVAEVMELMVSLTRSALDDALAYLGTQSLRYAELHGRPVREKQWQPTVLTVAELMVRVQERGGVDAQRRLDELTARLATDPSMDLPLFSRHVVEVLWSLSGLVGPAAVVGFGSLYYPPAYLEGATPRQARLREAVTKHVSGVARESGVSIQLRPFFPGISDMSFLGSSPTADDIAIMTANTAAWASRIRFDYQALGALDLPTINIGPWGRDYHQRTERVQMPYSFEIVPELIWRIARDVLHAQPTD